MDLEEKNITSTEVMASEKMPAIVPTSLKKRMLLFVGLILWCLSPAAIATGLLMAPIYLPALAENSIYTSIPVQIGIAIFWLCYAIATIIGIGRLYKRYRPVTEVPKRLRLKDIGIDLLYFIGMKLVAFIGSVLSVIFTLVSSQSLPETKTPLQYPEIGTTGTTIGIILWMIAVSFVAPILEEYVFRGIFSAIFFRTSKRWIPLVVSSIIFSLMHFSVGYNSVSFLMYFGLGVLLYFGYLRQRNVYDSILIHILNNIIAIVGVVLFLIAVLMI